MPRDDGVLPIPWQHTDHPSNLVKNALVPFCFVALLAPHAAECAVVSFQTALPYTASFANSGGILTIAPSISISPYRGSNSSGYVNYTFFSFTPGTMEFMMPAGEQSYVASLEEGDVIEANLDAAYAWKGGSSWRVWHRQDQLAVAEGNFTAGQGVIGFRFSDGAGGYHYGYFKGEVAPDGSTFTITEGGYQTAANTPVTVAVPEPSAALMGALATLSLLSRRRR